MNQDHDEFPFDESKKPKSNSQPGPNRKRKAKAVPKAWKAKAKVKSKGPSLKPDLSGGAVKKPPAAPVAPPKYEFQPTEYEVVEPTQVRVVVKVFLEPELEALVNALQPFERLRLAIKFRRWARQLEVSAKMMVNQSKPRLKPKVPRVNWTRAVWN